MHTLSCEIKRLQIIIDFTWKFRKVVTFYEDAMELKKQVGSAI